MIEAIYFEQVGTGAQWEFNTDVCPLKSFEIDGDTRITDRAKMQEEGDWQSFNYLGHQMIHLAGDLIGDTSEDYIFRRLLMMRTICPPRGRQRNRKWGTLFLTYWGQEEIHNDVTGDGYPDLPMDGTNPTVTAYTVNFKVFNPYWIGAPSGNRYLI